MRLNRLNETSVYSDDDFHLECVRSASGGLEKKTSVHAKDPACVLKSQSTSVYRH